VRAVGGQQGLRLVKAVALLWLWVDTQWVSMGLQTAAAGVVSATMEPSVPGGAHRVLW
jgi:hypothetical protein